MYKVQCEGTQKHSFNACKAALSETLDELLQFWDRAHIPTKQRKHVSSQLQSRIDEWKALKKNQSRSTNTQSTRVKQFELTLDVLFDIAPHDVMKQIKIEEDKQLVV